MKKLLCCLLIIFVWLNVSFSQNPNSKTPQMGETFASFMKLPHQQLYDTAIYYHKNNILDTALILYGIIINAPESSDSLQMLLTVGSLSMAGVIYLTYSDFRNAYRYMTDALILAEKYNFESELQIIYNNLGMIYFHFAEYDIAKTYYLKALNLTDDKPKYFGVLTNIASIEREKGNMDSAFIYYDKALTFSKSQNSVYLPAILYDISLFYKKTNQIDSTLYYCKYSVNEAKKKNDTRSLIESYHEIGNIFFEKNQFDSAVFYLNLSNSIAVVEKQSITVMPKNYLTLSKIEESKGNIRKAFDYYKKYSSLKDSIYNNNILGDINQIQRQYEVSKTNRQIEQFLIEQQIKERTIHYQKIIGMITIGVLLLMIFVLFVIILQRRKLIRAYKVLVEKNVEIIKFQQKVPISETFQKELLHRIVTLMETNPIIYDVEFSLEELSKLVQSNQNYVSRVIKNHFHKNFRSFINSYRIREAQQLFSEPDAVKYSIEYVANRVGFKSRNAFHDAFKEITGVSPSFYVKSIHATSSEYQETCNEL
ncbi:MAG: helix-turn-helix domain-containing protein [Lentimicrobiaceae bacterium]|nr:helix-turn-helix domain-containing protein [Lentimicrobiaceae bacterium]